jgi:hypothetical protein
MRMVALALGSFVLGALIGSSLFSGIHTSMEAQAASPNAIFIGNSKYELPVVSPIDPTVAMKNGTVGGNEGTVVQLDGLNCEHCTFGDSVFEYSGGAINCVDCQFTSPEKTINFGGAALNAIRLWQYFQSLKVPTPAPKPYPWEENPKIQIKVTAPMMDLRVLQASR